MIACSVAIQWQCCVVFIEYGTAAKFHKYLRLILHEQACKLGFSLFICVAGEKSMNRRQKMNEIIKCRSRTVSQSKSDLRCATLHFFLKHDSHEVLEHMNPISEFNSRSLRWSVEVMIRSRLECLTSESVESLSALVTLLIQEKRTNKVTRWRVRQAMMLPVAIHGSTRLFWLLC